MHHFDYKNGELYAEDIPVRVLAEKYGTPFYCYSTATLRRHARVFADAFENSHTPTATKPKDDTLVAYSVKALSNIAVLKILSSEGFGADVVSGGELIRARKAGIPAQKIVFSGVGKSEDEMRLALAEGIYQFNVESYAELVVLNEIASDMGKIAPIAFRINPDIIAGTHDKISTGRKEDKFGIAFDQAMIACQDAMAMPGIDVKGIDLHIGSQITALAPFETAFTKIRGLIFDLRKAGVPISRLDLGGGLGIPYVHAKTPDHLDPPHPDEYARMIRRLTDDLDVQLIFEPGRMIAGNAGMLVSKIHYVKETETRNFVILDSAMNDLIRPALYGALHEVMPVKENVKQPINAMREYDIVGPVCETGDTFAKAQSLPSALTRGDLMVMLSAGAYGAVQSSEYNTRPLIKEILVDGDKHAVIRQAPTIDEMLERETIPDWI